MIMRPMAHFPSCFKLITDPLSIRIDGAYTRFWGLPIDVFAYRSAELLSFLFVPSIAYHP